MREKLPLQEASVATVANPRNTLPSPLPLGSQELLAKTSTRYIVLAVAFKVPAMVVLVASEVAEVSTGKFCLLFAPVSQSQASLAVRPSTPRSIPKPEFEKIELPESAFPVLVVDTPIPGPWLKAITFP